MCVYNVHNNHFANGGMKMADKNIKKEKKKPKGGVKPSIAALTAPVSQPELIKKDKKGKM